MHDSLAASVSRDIFVVSEFKFIIELLFVRLALVFPLGKQVLKLGTVSSVIHINNARGLDRLPGVSPLKNLAEKRRLLPLLTSHKRPYRIELSFDVLIAG